MRIGYRAAQPPGGSGARPAVVIRNETGTVANFGTLTSTGTYNTVDLFAGGSVTNGSNASTKALISGGSASAVDVNGAAGTVTNFGTIEAGTGVVLSDGGTVENRTGGRIIADKGNGVGIEGVAGTVTNLGTISGAESGISLAQGGSIANGSATATSVLIRGSDSAFGPPAVNISGGVGTVSNFGTIRGGFYAVNLVAGGTIRNGSSSSTAAQINGFLGGTAWRRWNADQFWQDRGSEHRRRYATAAKH